MMLSCRQLHALPMITLGTRFDGTRQIVSECARLNLAQRSGAMVPQIKRSNSLAFQEILKSLFGFINSKTSHDLSGNGSPFPTNISINVRRGSLPIMHFA